MKKILKSSLLFASLAVVASGATAGISDTKHNLTTSGTGPNKQSTTQQICVFCHTPHASNTTISAPLWNKTTPSGTYSTYAAMNSTTIDGQILAVGSVSAACLSCHDGTQAMDNIINAPGSGQYDSTGGGSGGLAYSWSSGGDTIGGTGTNTVANLSQDLKNDHPIGIEYCGGGVSGSGTTVSGTCKDSDFITQNSASLKLQTKEVNGQQVFWVDTTTSGTRTKNDMILYTRTFTGGVSRPSVECASCHDPHVSDTDSGADLDFMRVTTAGSKICLACHVK